MSDRKTCPYCGEDIAATAKKCRFCGEWLDVELAVPETVAAVNAGVAEPLQPQGAEYARPVEAPVVNDCTGAHGLPATVNINGVPQSVDPSAVVQQYGGTLQQPVQQPVQHPMQQVINVQVHQEQTQSQEQTQIVVNEKSSSSGWLWFELLCVGGRRMVGHRPLVGRTDNLDSARNIDAGAGDRRCDLRCVGLRRRIACGSDFSRLQCPDLGLLVDRYSCGGGSHRLKSRRQKCG